MSGSGGLLPIQVFGLIFSRYCVAECAHCGSSAGPRVRGVMPLELAARCLDDLPAFGVKSIVVSGGEPLAFFDDICRLGELAGERGLDIQVCSNGYWAKSERRALSTLSALKDRGLVHLLLSTDQFHVKFVPVESVIRAANAASNLGVSCQIAVPSMARDFKATSLLTRLRKETYALVFAHPVHPIGRGADLPAQLLSWRSPEVRGCDLLGHIELDWTGTVSCCPPSADYDQGNPLVLGNASEEPLREILTRFRRTPVYRVIAEYGPVGLRTLLNHYVIKTGSSLEGRIHECHLCRDITSNTRLFDVFAKQTGIDLLEPMTPAQIAEFDELVLAVMSRATKGSHYA